MAIPYECMGLRNNRTSHTQKAGEKNAHDRNLNDYQRLVVQHYRDYRAGKVKPHYAVPCTDDVAIISRRSFVFWLWRLS